jgi:hypothetical protein
MRQSKQSKIVIANLPIKPKQSIANKVKFSAHEIWLAGLGAFAHAQAVDSELFFNDLVREGQAIESLEHHNKR